MSDEPLDMLDIEQQFALRAEIRERYTTDRSTALESLAVEYKQAGYPVTYELLREWSKQGKWGEVRRANLHTGAAAIAPKGKTERALRALNVNESAFPQVSPTQQVLSVSGVGDDFLRYLERSALRAGQVELLVSEHLADLTERQREYIAQMEEYRSGTRTEKPNPANRVGGDAIAAALRMIGQLDDLRYVQMAARARADGIRSLLGSVPVPAPGYGCGDDEDGQS